jgi:WD40 repeat protein
VPINSIGVSPSKVNFATGADEGKVNIWELSSMDPITTIDAHSDYVKRVRYLNADTLVTSSYDKTVKLWDARAEDSVSEMKYKVDEPIEDFTFVSDTMLGIANGSFISLWDIRSPNKAV